MKFLPSIRMNMKRTSFVLLLLLYAVLLTAQSHYDYMDDSAVAGGANRAFNGLLFIILLIIGAIVLLLLGNVFFKIYYGLNPEAKPEYKAQKAKEERENKQKVEIKHNDIDSPYQPIDLGLSVKWSSVNLGVSEAWQTMFYNYYFWGELHPNFKTYDLSNINFSNIGDISGNPQYDIVSKTLNNGWRIPTKFELKELVEKCKWTKEEMGYKVESSNGNSIFLPYTGFFTFDSNPFTPEHSDEGCYWSSTPKEKASETLNQSAYSLTFGGRYLVPTIHERLGYNAIAIRPVKN